MSPILIPILALILSLIAVSVIRRVSKKLGFIAQPRQDRWNKNPTPTLGGVGIYLAFVITVVVYSIVDHSWDNVRLGILISATGMFALGLYDDIKPITPPVKLLGQIVAASVVVFMGFTTDFFTVRLPGNILAQIPNILITFLWLIGITNAINLIDNMDGLAGGISLITAGILSFLFWKAGNTPLLALSLALAGSLLGFLYFNFPPASIFMGDSGSLFIGFTLATLAIARQPQASNVFAILGVPTILFLMPILDTALVTVTRIIRGQSPSQGGQDHTSHRLIAFGLSERQTLFVLYGVAIISGIVAIVLESLDYDLSLVLIPLLMISIAIFTAYLSRMKVVVSPSPNKASTFTKFVVEFTYRRRIFEIVLDFFVISVAYYLSFWTMNGFSMNTSALEQYFYTLPIALSSAYISFLLFGVYRGVWKYVDVDEIINFIKVVLTSVFILAIVIEIIYKFKGYSPVVFLLFAIFLFLGLTATRSSFKVLDQISNKQARGEEQRVIICGAGDAGEMAVRWIQMNPQLHFHPIGFLDRDSMNKGRHIHGIEILGGYDMLNSIVDQEEVDGIIITENDLDTYATLREISSICRSYGCWIRTLKLEFELIE